MCRVDYQCNCTLNLTVKSILDIGCGTGVLANELKNMNFEVCEIDISEDMINVAKETTKGIKFEVGDMIKERSDLKFLFLTKGIDRLEYCISVD